MAEVIDLERFRLKLAADKGFRTWLARFQEQFGPDTRLKDLSPQTLLELSRPGEENLYVLFDLIMGAEGLGGSARFRLDDLDVPTKLKIIDTAVMLMDRVRFEVLRRLAWVAATPDENLPIIALVHLAWRQSGDFGQGLPQLARSHPEYEAYQRLPQRDQGMFLRRLLPRAVAQFQAIVAGRSE